VDTIQVLKIQAELAQRTLADTNARHKRLYRLVCDEGWLRLGLEKVLSNKGSNTPGVDGETKKKIEARKDGRQMLIQQLREELLSGSYRPQPVKRVYIPKANGKKRPLGIATIRDRVVQATVKMVIEPIYESVFHPFSWGFRPLRSTHHALSAARRGPHDLKNRYKWVIEGDIAACFDEIDHRLLRKFLKKRIQDRKLLDLITRMLRCGIWEKGRVSYPQTGTTQGSGLSPLLANVYLHEFDEWYYRTYRVRPEWAHMTSGGLQYHRKKDIGGTLILTRYADDWVAMWNGSRESAEEIKSEIKTFLADELKLRLSEEKTLITHIDDGFDFLGYQIKGNKRWTDGRWCLFSKVSKRGIERFRKAVKQITRNVFNDEAATFAALSNFIRGWGNYYAYAAESNLMDSLDAYVYRELWRYCRSKNSRMGAKAVYDKYTLPPRLRATGHFQLGLVVGQHIVRIPRLSSIVRKHLILSYPPHPYLQEDRIEVLPEMGRGDEHWWDRRLWTGTEGLRSGQKRLALEVIARDVTCQICGENPATEVHHTPQWKDTHDHDPEKAIGVCSECHRQMLQDDG
jgi:RNA-directed DNA polymerase